MNRTAHHAAMIATLSLLIMPVGANAEALKARDVDGELILVGTARQGSYLKRADGTRVDLPLPPTALVQSFAAGDGQWYAAAVDLRPGGRRLVVLKGSGAKVKELPAPAVLHAAELREPSLLVVEGALAGMAWVEGKAPRQQVVRVAAWSVGGWREPVTVSPRGPGSQMALATTRLGDGSWLLAWAAFDGSDDEIMWSRWDASRWSAGDGVTAPARLAGDNAVPDITPHLWTTPDGAMAAWSCYDGDDYRVHLARFDGTAWSEPDIRGPKGSVYPTFHPGSDGPLLLYQNAWPRGWSVAELDGQGRVRRLAEIETLNPERPLLGEDGASLMWIGEGGASDTSDLIWRPVE